MATNEMSIDERYQYLSRMQSRYQQADRKTKQQLLDEMEAYTGLHRKSLIRRLRGTVQRQPPLPSACRVAARRQWLCPRGGCRRHRAVVEGGTVGRCCRSRRKLAEGALTGCDPPASANGGSGKIAAICYHPTQRLTCTFTPPTEHILTSNLATPAVSGACPEVCRRMAMRQGSSAVYFLLGDHGFRRRKLGQHSDHYVRSGR
ncbi:MAG: hypothetical protein ACP5J4_00400 [Anaerolineae bacterium]